MRMSVASLAIAGALTLPTNLFAQTDFRWDRLFEVSAGARLQLETDTSAGKRCRLLAVDDTGLTVVNTRNLPRRAARVVTDLAQHRPERLVSAGAEYIEDNARLDRDGLWIGSQLITTRDRLVERIDRQAVVEVRYARTSENNGGRDALIGLTVGATVGYWFGAVLGCGQGAVVAECRGVGRLMMLVGGGVGAAVGAATGEYRQSPSGVIYRRP